MFWLYYNLKIWECKYNFSSLGKFPFINSKLLRKIVDFRTGFELEAKNDISKFYKHETSHVSKNLQWLYESKNIFIVTWDHVDKPGGPHRGFAGLMGNEKLGAPETLS